jgi:hypothetical protein
VTLYVGSPAWLEIGRPLASFAALILVLSIAVNARWGWEHRGVRLSPDRSTPVGPSGAHQLQLLAESSDGARPRTGNKGTILLPSGGSVYDAPYRYQLVDQGELSATLTATRSNGTLLTLYEYTIRPEPSDSLNLDFSSTANDQDRLFIIAEEQMVGRLRLLANDSAAKELRFHLWIFDQDGQTLIGDQEISFQDGVVRLDIGGVTYELATSRFAIVDVTYAPGSWPFRLALLLMVAGLVVTLVPRHHARITIQEQSGETVVESWSCTAGIRLFAQDDKSRPGVNLRDLFSGPGREA